MLTRIWCAKSTEQTGSRWYTPRGQWPATPAHTPRSYKHQLDSTQQYNSKQATVYTRYAQETVNPLKQLT